MGSTRCAARGGSDGTVSIVKIVSLSPRVENLKVKKVIKISYLNYRESSVFRVFRDSYAYVNVLHILIFHVFIYYGYVTGSRINISLYLSSFWINCNTTVLVWFLCFNGISTL